MCFSRGQLGHGDTESQSEPRIIEDLEAVTMVTVSAGGWHSVALSGESVVHNGLHVMSCHGQAL